MINKIFILLLFFSLSFLKVNAQDQEALMGNTIVLFNKPVTLKATSQGLLRCDIFLKVEKNEDFAKRVREAFLEVDNNSVVEWDATYKQFTFIFQKSVLQGQVIDFVKKKMTAVDPQIIIGTYRESSVIFKGVE